MRLALPLVLVALAGCAGGAADTTPALAYACEDGRTLIAAYPTPGTATVVIGDETHELRAEAAASGARFGDGRTTFWSRGTEATLESRESGALTRCRVDLG